MKQEIVKNENILQRQQIGMQPFSIEMDKNIQMNPLYVPSSKSNNNKNRKVKGKKNDTQKRTLVETILHHVIIVAILFLFYGIPTLLLYTTISLDKYLDDKPYTVNSTCLIYTIVIPWILENTFRNTMKKASKKNKVSDPSIKKKMKKERKLWLGSKLICVVLLFIAY